ncbi:hypothetical protein JOC61_000313, partial [Marinitoga litoralis]|nr:hypothetical protein [Marinitoga litoralis]
MELSIKDIIDIVRYGYYSNSIINHIFLNTKEKALKYYFLLLKAIWKKEYDIAIFYAKKVISTTTTTIILKELARFELISLYVKNNEFELAKKECEYLRNNFDNISEYARNLMIPGLKLLNKKYNFFQKDFKVYSDNYIENNVDMAILKYTQARDYIKKKNYNKAYQLFIEGYLYAKEFPHPTMICNGLNGAAWWIRKVDKKKALVAADLLEYYIGYYFEDLKYIYNWLDTIFEVKKINNDVRIIEITNIVNKLKKVYPEVNIEDNFDKFIEVKKLKRKIKKLYKMNIDKFDVSKIDIAFLSTYASLIEKPYFTKSR